MGERKIFARLFGNYCVYDASRVKGSFSFPCLLAVWPKTYRNYLSIPLFLSLRESYSRAKTNGRFNPDIQCTITELVLY